MSLAKNQVPASMRTKGIQKRSMGRRSRNGAVIIQGLAVAGETREAEVVVVVVVALAMELEHE
jgi:hypothetical protein